MSRELLSRLWLILSVERRRCEGGEKVARNSEILMHVVRRAGRRCHRCELHLLLLSHLVLLLEHGPLLGVHLLLHETASLAVYLETVGRGRDLVARRELLLVIELEVGLLLLGVLLLHLMLIHRIRAKVHVVSYGLAAEVLLSSHGARYPKVIMASEILRSSAGRCTQLAHILVKWCGRVRAWVGLRNVLAKAIAVNVWQAVQVEIVDVEYVGDIIETGGHRGHVIHVVGRLRPDLVDGGVHGCGWSACEARRASSCARRVQRNTFKSL